MNLVVFIGRLTRDPELRYMQNGKAVCNFSLAVPRSYKTSDGKQPTDFFNVAAFDKNAENCAKYLSKGKLVAIAGKMQSNTYQDKTTGTNRTNYQVQTERVQFLSPKNSKEDGAEEPTQLADTLMFDDDSLPF